MDRRHPWSLVGQKSLHGAGEMARRSRVVMALVEELGFTPSTRVKWLITTWNSSSVGWDILFWLLQAHSSAHTPPYTDICIYTKKERPGVPHEKTSDENQPWGRNTECSSAGVQRKKVALLYKTVLHNHRKQWSTQYLLQPGWTLNKPNERLITKYLIVCDSMYANYQEGTREMAQCLRAQLLFQKTQVQVPALT